MLMTGIILGPPYALGLLDGEHPWYLVGASQMALIIILTPWADLGLDLSGLKRWAGLQCSCVFVPAGFELLGMLFLAPKLLGITWLEAAVMGAVLAAVSPAVVVPRMVKLMEEGYGGERRHPQLILAGASVDDCT